MKNIILLTCLIVISNYAYAWDVTCSKKGNKHVCNSWFVDENHVTGKQKKIKISFYVDKGNIDTSTICKNQPYGSLEQRKCATQSVKMFKEFCKKDRRKYKMYCAAGRRFNPVM